MIAFIFIKESVLKLLEIRHSYRFSNDPTVYAKHFTESTKCFRCLYIGDVQQQQQSSNLTSSTPTTIYRIDNLSMLNESACNRLGPKYEFTKLCDYQPDIFFVSVVLYLFTFFLAMTFRYFRTSRFFPSAVRIFFFLVTSSSTLNSIRFFLDSL